MWRLFALFLVIVTPLCVVAQSAELWERAQVGDNNSTGAITHTGTIDFSAPGNDPDSGQSSIILTVDWTDHIIADNFLGAKNVSPADVDGDGDMDIFGAAYTADKIVWWENVDGSAGSWIEHTVTENFDMATYVEAADFDEDGDMDVVCASGYNAGVSWMENSDGSGLTWVPHIIEASFNVATDLSVFDLTGDGHLDVVATSLGLSQLAYWYSNYSGGGPGVTSPKIIAIGGLDTPRCVDLGDIDNDGDADVICGTSGSGRLYMREYRSGYCYPVHSIDFPNCQDAIFADIDGDGYQDIISSSSPTGYLRWWRNTGTTNIWTVNEIANVNVGELYAADVDSDGDMDILSAAVWGASIQWWENADGIGTAWTEHSIVSDFTNANDVCAIDLDNDGDRDIIGVSYGLNDVMWWEQLGVVSQPPSAFALISPADGTILTSLTTTLQWQEAIDPDPDDSVTYTLHVSEIEGRLGRMVSSGLTETSYNFTGEDDTQYWWTVRAVDSYGVLTSADTTWNFSIYVEEPPVAFNLLSPSNEEVLETPIPTVSWEASSDPDPEDTVTYTLYWSINDPDFTDPESETGLTDTSYTFDDDVLLGHPGGGSGDDPVNGISFRRSTRADEGRGVSSHQSFSSGLMVAGLDELDDLPDDVVVYWYVHAVDTNTGGTLSNQNPIDGTTISFSIDIAAPPTPFCLLTPSDGDTIWTADTLLTWEESFDPENETDVIYTVLIGNQPDLSDAQVLAEGLMTTEYQVTNLQDNTNYYWTVRADNFNPYGTLASDTNRVYTVFETEPIFEGFSVEHPIAENFNYVFTVYATDVDGDGDTDVLGAAINADDITWWENNGSEVFTEHTIAGDFDGAWSVYATDVDGDGDTDVLGTAEYADEIAWWENNGSEIFTEHTIATNYDCARSVYAADVDGDGDVDVLGAAYNAGDITWWENNGSEVFTEHTIAGNFNGAHSVYATDVDGDGDTDVLGAAWHIDDITWWENNGSEVFTEHTIAGNFDGACSVYATDVDCDGDMDVLGAAWYAGDITWWENNGSEVFTEHAIAGNFTGAYSVYATDVDGDGDTDVLGAAGNADDITWWENDGSEVFTEHTIAGNFNGACSVYATDVDGDGDTDVLGAAEFASDITWWENETVLLHNYPPQPFALQSPTYGDTITSRVPTLTWHGAYDPNPPDQNQLQYRVFWSLNPEYTDSDSSNLITDTTYTFSNLLPDDSNIYWKVKAIDPGGRFTWSEQSDWYFHVAQPDPPAAFALVEPANQSIVHVDTVTVTWSATTDPDPNDSFVYYVEWSLDENYEAFYSDTTSNLFYVITDLADLLLISGAPGPDDIGIIATGRQQTTSTSSGTGRNNSPILSTRVNLSHGVFGIDELPDDNTVYWRVRALDTFGLYTYADPGDGGFNFMVDVQEGPAAFTLLSPEDEDTSFTLTPTLIWQESEDPDPYDIAHYDVWLDTLADLSTMWLVGDSLNDTELVLDELFDDHVYYWTVRATDSNTDGTWASDTLMFNTYLVEPPTAFSLLLPEQASVVHDDTIMVHWSHTTDPDPNDSFEFQVEWSLDSEFGEYYTGNTSDTFFVITDLADLLLISDAPGPDDIGIIATGRQQTTSTSSGTGRNDSPILSTRVNLSPGVVGIDELPDDNTVYWRVRALDTFGLYTYADPGDGGFNFTVDVQEGPSAFTLLSPEDEDTSFILTPTLIWQESEDPDPYDIAHYDVWMDTLADLSTMWPAGDSLSETEMLLEELFDDHVYYWTVRATDSNTDGTWANDTLSFSIYMEEPPTPFDLLTPVDEAEVSTFTPTVTWEESTDPDPDDTVTYTLYWSINDPDFTDPDSVVGLTGTSFTFDEGTLLPGNPGGGSGDDPVNGVSLRRSEPPENEHRNVSSRQSFTSGPLVAGLDELDDLPDDVAVYWYVVAHDGDADGTPSNQNPMDGTTWSFSIYHPDAPGPFDLVSPEDEAISATLTVDLTWTASDNLDPEDTITYEVYVSTDPDDPGAAVATGITETTYTFAGEDDLNYWWSIKAVDTNTDGTWANDTLSFSIYMEEPPTPFNLLTPENEEIVTLEDPWDLMFVWSNSIDPDPNDTVRFDFYSHFSTTDFDSSVSIIGMEDSTYTINIPGLLDTEFWEEAITGDWWVIAIANEDTVRCTDSVFSFTIEPFSDVDDLRVGNIPTEYSIESIYPNPFNPTVTVRIGIPEPSNISITVYDLLGRVVCELENGHIDIGYHSYLFDATDLANGVYFVRVQAASSFHETRKIILLK